MSDDQTNVAADELRSFIERIERLEEDKKEIGADIKDVYGEAKSRGYDTKVMRKLVAIRKQDQNERQEQDAILELYMMALGMGIQERLPLADEDLRTRRPARKSMEDRAAARLTEAMADTKDLSAEMLADGLITPEAHAENVALSDAVAARAHGRKSARKARSAGKDRPLHADDAEDERLRNERAKGPVFA
ncbi:hypothetical protein Sa4125_25470 [Aureimonas sp. SA4125]|nr:hypothetical protein Sa4125_25470 [Aureimonas sp. SA4125]